MSAPIVDETGEYLGLSKARRLFINVWFRHVIFLVYPLSSVLVLTSILTDTNIWSLILMQLPVMIIMIITGYAVGLIHFKKKTSLNNLKTNQDENDTRLLPLLMPIIASITISHILSPFIDYRYHLPLNRLSMIIGIFIGIMLLFNNTRSKPKVLLRLLYSRDTIELAMIGFSAMLIRKTLAGLDPGCFISISNYIHPIVLVIIIPSLFSLITGITSTSIVLSIPIVSKLITITPQIASLLFVSAYIPYIPSPLHLCLIYTAKYYKISIIRSYRYLVPATLASLTMSIALYLLLYI